MANNKTFINLPPDVTDPIVLKRFLDELIQKLDIAFGNRGSSNGFSTVESTEDLFNAETFGNLKKYAREFDIDNDRILIDKGFADAEYGDATVNPEQAAISLATYTKANPGATYSQAEAVIVDNGVDSLKTKINQIIVALQAADILG